MRNFFKIFFASLLALVIFSVVVFFIGIWVISSAATADKPVVGNKAVLVIDLSQPFPEQSQENPIAEITGNENANVLGLYDVVRMIQYAKKDSAVKGLVIKAGYNANGFATNEELREAIADFKQSKKFVLAYGEYITQKSYYVATAADKIYCNPQGMLEWDGIASNLLFLKGALDKLEIVPQIFYAGKYKSATEPFRATQMTAPNKEQTTVWLNDLYGNLLLKTSEARGIDTATLHQLANTGAIQTTHDAVEHKLIDGLKYDDEWKAEISTLLGQKKEDKINFVTASKYSKAVDFKNTEGKDKIAVIYAEGEIVGGKSDDGVISSDRFKNLLRKVRQDESIKAIVFRVNSPGGSALASDVIWREVSLARAVKPVVVSMGDVAASGGYYIACNADSVFADYTTITGSIGVFSMIPDMSAFFKNKLGVTFDGVKTAPFADMGNNTRPLTETEKRFFQNSVDSIYHTFKSRVADGRKKDIDFIDSIAQGRVWTGKRALQIGLVDRIGTLHNAVECAARLAKTSDYRTREYPEQKNFMEQIFGSSNTDVKEKIIKEEIGEPQYKIFKQIKKVQDMFGIPQARLPFDFDLN
ncbi:signal peptide peptidase SppA [Foetidibacter luteolus]|uniref:signal peptide peptidase SppA n=1 Tax=Foetidibacter luteolus TaxID=2608880 RepID=UPI00129A5E0C|nr:signal peptide peptidase SppA [Foetidibacter luteolus]